jgi:hypothetical protein
MKFLKNFGIAILILLILAGAIAIRVTSYGDFKLSIANADTSSYILGGTAPFPSTDMFTRVRLFTTNLVYHLANVQDCKIQAMSYPALGTETYRQAQLCFDKITVFQNILSIIAWSILALVIAKRLNGTYEKLLAALAITTFGFTPAVADWDSVLSSESLAFSLFAISVALVVEVFFNVAADEGNEKYSTVINVLAVLFLGLWAFTRDANIYTLVALLAVSVLAIIISPTIRKNRKLLVVTATVFIIVVAGLQSAAKSGRWMTPMGDVFNDLILPYPARADYMKSLGMPDHASAEYTKWFADNAPRAYARFLISHPGYVSTSLIPELGSIFYENTQPYFFSKQTTTRTALIAANDILHPGTYLVLILDILLIAGLTFSSFRRKNRDLTVWVWLGLWLFLSASLTLVVSFFADSIGVTRHTMFAVEMFRLMMWVFLIVLLDQANQKDEKVNNAM